MILSRQINLNTSPLVFFLFRKNFKFMKTQILKI